MNYYIDYIKNRYPRIISNVYSHKTYEWFIQNNFTVNLKKIIKGIKGIDISYSRPIILSAISF